MSLKRVNAAWAWPSLRQLRSWALLSVLSCVQGPLPLAHVAHSTRPQVGGFLGETGGWRWVAALIAIFTGVLTVMGAIIVPETYGPVLLRRRAALLSKVTGHVYRSKHEKEKKLDVAQLFKTALARPWIFLFKEPIVLLLSI